MTTANEISNQNGEPFVGPVDWIIDWGEKIQNRIQNRYKVFSGTGTSDPQLVSEFYHEYKEDSISI